MRFGVSATVLLACALPCAPAHAASVSVGATFSSNTVVYVADPGETNTVTVAEAGDQLRVRDTGAPLRAVSPCRPVDAHEALCPSPTYLGVLRASLGDGDDSITIEVSGPPAPGAWSADLRGGGGGDVLVGGPATTA